MKKLLIVPLALLSLLLVSCGSGGNLYQPEEERTLPVTQHDSLETPSPSPDPEPDPEPLPENRSVSLLNMDGEVAVLQNGAEVSAELMMPLREGYSITTGEASRGYLRIDEYSLVVLDENTHIIIEQVTPTSITIAVEEGQILVDVQDMPDGNELHVRRGDDVLTIEGTLVTVGKVIVQKYVDGILKDFVKTQIHMLEGRGVINGYSLRAGFSMAIDNFIMDITEIIVEALTPFVLWAIETNLDRVIAARAITAEQWENFINPPDAAELLVGTWNVTFHSLLTTYLAPGANVVFRADGTGVDRGIYGDPTDPMWAINFIWHIENNGETLFMNLDGSPLRTTLFQIDGDQFNMEFTGVLLGIPMRIEFARR